MTDPRESLAGARLYLVAGAGLTTATLDAVIDAGVGMIQLRDKGAEALSVIASAAPYQDAARARRIPFVINDRADIARAVAADGVHLGQDDLPPRNARALLGPLALIGRSTHSPAQVDAALAERDRGDVDYIAVGPVHATPTKPGRPAVGLDLVRYAARHADLPWFAIGGIDASTIAPIVDAGAARIVVVRAITEAADPVAATKALLAVLPTL